LSEARPIYLDNHAHALLDPRVAAVLCEALTTFDANPHSLHLPGEAAHRAVESARRDIAALIGSAPGEVVLTSGATEANNLAILGLSHYCASLGRPRVLVGAGEHPSVLAAADFISNGEAVRIPLLSDGSVNIDALKSLLCSEIGIVSISAANHEIGSIQNLAEISALVRSAGALFHSDLAQAAAWIAIDSDLLDLASLSAHKIGGPIGVGAMFVRRRHRRHLVAQTHGGGQEHGARAGTVSAPLCVAFGEAARLALSEREATAVRIAALRDGLLRHLMTATGVRINGGANRLPGNLNVSFDGVDGEALVLRLRNKVSLSTGSACTSQSLDPSHVLTAIGLDKDRKLRTMPSLASLGDGSAVANYYSDRLILMVEGGSDKIAFERFVGPGYDADLVFQVAPTANGSGGCQAVRDRVSEERQHNDKVFGLLDGEAVAVLDGVKELYESEEVLFRLPEREELLFLNVHELENLYFAHADVCGAISHHKPVKKLDEVTAAAVEISLDENLDRYLGAACYKYASAYFYSHNQMPRLINTRIFDTDPIRNVIAILKSMVTSGSSLTWPQFKQKVRALQCAGSHLLRSRGYDQAEIRSWKLRIADGKELLRRLRRLNGEVGDAVEGHLLAEVCGSAYPTAFRDRLFALIAYTPPE
jgi:cysteine desulfurase